MSQNSNHVSRNGIRNPYDMKIEHVKPKHFIDARLYDHQLTENGFYTQLFNDTGDTRGRWYVSSRQAHNKYRQWLRNVRNYPGNELFRRVLKEIEYLEQDSNGEHHITKKMVPLYPINKPRVNRPYYLPQSKDKGVSVDDIEYVPRLFTERMGREISSLRNNLGMTQSELAKKINIDVPMIRNIEIGGIVTFNPNDKLVRLLATVLKVSSIKYQE